MSISSTVDTNQYHHNQQSPLEVSKKGLGRKIIGKNPILHSFQEFKYSGLSECRITVSVIARIALYIIPVIGWIAFAIDVVRGFETCCTRAKTRSLPHLEGRFKSSISIFGKKYSFDAKMTAHILYRQERLLSGKELDHDKVTCEDLSEAIAKLTEEQKRGITEIRFSHDDFILEPHGIRTTPAPHNFPSLLKSLPKNISELQNLRVLDLFGCDELESIPESLGDLKNLKTLSLAGCVKLKALPRSFVKLTSLENLDLGGCRSLQGFPKSWDHLTKLRGIEIRGCSGPLPPSMHYIK